MAISGEHERAPAGPPDEALRRKGLRVEEVETAALRGGASSTDALREPAAPSPAHLRPGDVFAGRFRIVSSIGRGGFSFVYRAEEISTGVAVALKFLSASDSGGELARRMQRELRLARDLTHPNIVRVNELLEAEGYFCLSMELLEGMTLKELILARRPLPIDEALGLLRTLTLALAAVHTAGVVHRDLKPQNVIVTRDGTVKLLDFGLARTPDSTGLTATGTILGTPEYMSPEQVEGKSADARSDLYSLGIIGYELFTGVTPYRAESPMATALQHIRSRVPDPRTLRPDVPADVAALIFRLTEPAPARRPSGAPAILLDLERRGGGTSLVPGRRRPMSARRKVGLAVASLLGAGGLAASALLLRGPAPPADPLADGVVHLAIAGEGGAEDVSGRAFMAALVETVGTRISDPRVVSHPLETREVPVAFRTPEKLRRDGIEQVLQLRLRRNVAEGDRIEYVLTPEVKGTADGRTWVSLSEERFSSWDMDQVDRSARRLSREYLDALSTAAARGEGRKSPRP